MSNTAYIILLNYNGLQDTLECIASLQLLQNVDFKVIVVDNSDTIDNFEALKDFAKKQEYSSIWFNQNNYSSYQDQHLILIKSNENKGFSHGNNIGIQFALQQKDANYFWILNNDTVVKASSLFHLIKQHNNEKVILGSKLLYYHQPLLIQAVGGFFNQRYYITEHVGEGMDSSINKEQLPKIDYPIGAAIFVNRAFIEEVGLLNEDYFLYYEELDWVFRAKKLDYTVDWCEDSIVYHKEGATIGSSYRAEKSIFSELEIFKSRKKFIKQHFGLNSKFYFTTILLIINRIRKGKFKLAKQLIKDTFNDNK